MAMISASGRSPLDWTCIVLLGILLLLGCQSATEADRSKVAPEVLAALRADGEVNVVISLVEPPGYASPGADPAQIRAEIARMQDDVLGRLDPEDYRNRQRFESVPALAGTLLSEAGLSVLASHRYVRRVDLDPAGGGTGVR